MTEKITITQEQANEIRDINDIAYAIDVHSFNKRPDKAIAGLSTADLARALLIGYEVEDSKMKSGHWAKCETKDGRVFIGKIRNVDSDEKAWSHWNGEKHYGFIDIKDLEKCTPEEITAEQERQKWAGIEKGDVVMHNDIGEIGMVIGIGEDVVSIKIGLQTIPKAWEKERCELYAKKVGATK